MSVLSVQNISKTYGVIKALQSVSFDVPQGSIFGILGPNGSGKTTLLGIVMDILKATDGNYLWMGQPGSNQQRKKIGTLLETPNFYAYLSAQRNLEIAAEIKGADRADIPRVLKIVNLYERKDSKFNSYSLGMKQRLAIASALLGNPDVLVFDEPTNGLDPAGIAEIRELMKKLSAQGKTIIMASHILDEVEKVCTHVAIIQKGVLKTVGTVAGVLDTKPDNATDIITVELAADNLEELQNILSRFSGIADINIADNGITAQFNTSVTGSTINKYCFDNGIILSALNIKRKTLETRFLEITGTKSDR
jgi:lantibiotic transport system ATP-binding protein